MSAPTTEAPYAYELGTKEATAAGKPFVTEAHDDHERAHRARLEESPAYEILKQHDLLTLRYRINSVEDIECVASNTTHSKNNRRIAMTFLAPGIGWCIYSSMTHTFEVPRGHIRLAEDGRGNYFFYGPGLHYIKDPYIRVQHENVPVGRGVLQHGNRTVVVIEQGYIGYAMDRGQPVLLPPGLHQWTSDTLVFEKMVDLNKNLIKLGPYTLLTVDEGYAAITQNNGRQVILPGGGMHFLTHRNWKFEKFMSQKIQTHSLERFEATSADNVLLVVIATVNWRIVDVEIAAKMAAETMRFDGSEVSQPGEDIRKLRNDVLRQAEASLASFIGTVNYSDTFHMAAAAHAPEAVSDDAMVLHGSAIFDVKKIKTAVEDANDVTMTYGVRVMSINIISAKPADNSLMMSLAKGAVAAAEAQQAETAAQGNASAARIEAEGLAQADVIRAKADAAAAEIRAEGAKRAAGLIESSSVATELAKIEKTGLALGKSSTFFFGNDPHAMSSVLANPALVPRR